MGIGAICAVLAGAAVLALTLRKSQPELSLGLSLLAGVGVAAVLLFNLIDAFETVRSLLTRAAIDPGVTATLFKALGVCLLTQFTADVCRDAGETGLAARAELAGKVAMLLLALPLFVQVAEWAVALMEGGG